MNAITQAVAALAPALASSHALSEYARGRAAHASLAPHATPKDLLDALAGTSPLSQKERDAIVLALLALHQRTRHPLWQAVLLTAYAPMLHGIAGRTLGVARDDARQGALAAFLEAIAKVRLDPPPVLVSLTLRHATERGAFAQSTFTDEPEAVSLEEARRALDPRDPLEVVEADEKMRKVVQALVDAFGDEGVAREVLDVLLHARTGRAALLEYVDTTYASFTRPRRDAMFARLSRMRARALRHLAAVFGGDLDAEVESSVA